MDDHAGWRKILADVLKRRGHTVTVARNRDEALNLIPREPFIQALALDILLGEGVEASAEICSAARRLKIPVVAVSGPATPTQVARLFQDFHIRAFFSKVPFDEAKFAFEIESIILGRTKGTSSGLRKPRKAVRKLKVFLCHASPDKPRVRRLYKRLLAEGIEPWLDKEDILPGERWEDIIPAALRAADAVLIFLSKRSVSKEGYVNTEIEMILDLVKQKRPETIFLIPVLLEDCTVPQRLKTWQRVDIYKAGDSFEKLLAALRERAFDLKI